MSHVNVIYFSPPRGASSSSVAVLLVVQIHSNGLGDNTNPYTISKSKTNLPVPASASCDTTKIHEERCVRNHYKNMTTMYQHFLPVTKSKLSMKMITTGRRNRRMFCLPQPSHYYCSSVSMPTKTFCVSHGPTCVSLLSTPAPLYLAQHRSPTQPKSFHRGYNSTTMTKLSS